MPLKCATTNHPFEVTDHEQRLRAQFGFESFPKTSPAARIRTLGAFWPHFHLHNRKCDLSGEKIISVYSSDCPYPVWHKSRWVQEANPPPGEYQDGEKVFPQMWKFFQHSAIPHNTGVGNENCEYTDDWFYSQNCYLSHSGKSCEEVRYCYRVRDARDCEFVSFAFNVELCVDVVNSRNCFNIIYGLNCRQVNDSAFVYDCRNCANCMFCFNLRNKQFCFGNVQLTKEEYLKERAKWDLTSRKVYNEAKEQFQEMMLGMAWHRALSIDNSENCTGEFIENARDCTNCYFLTGNEDCVNCVRSVSGDDKTCLDSVAHFDSELVFSCCLAQDNCYDTRFCTNVIQCHFVEYCSNCVQCKNCFGCCGLVGKEHYIFNRPYSKEDYKKERERIISHMKQTEEYGEFFPGYFSPVPYEESWSAIHFELSRKEQVQLGFRATKELTREAPRGALPVSKIPDSSKEVGEDFLKQVFWDEYAQRPIRFRESDIAFARKVGVPLSHTYYTTRLKENFSWMNYHGNTREGVCAKSNAPIQTSWPEKYNSRILSEEEYLKFIG